MSDTAYSPVIDKVIRVLDCEVGFTRGSALFDLRARALALREPPKPRRTLRDRRVAAISAREQATQAAARDR